MNTDWNKSHKTFIKNFCRYIHEQSLIGNEEFYYQFTGFEAYKIQDKSIDKRVEKYLLKKYHIDATCNIFPELYMSCDAEPPLSLLVHVKINKKYNSILWRI